MNNHIFQPSLLAEIKFKNKIVRSATHEGLADEKGYPTEQLKKLYVQLAKGDVGAIITSHTGIQQNGKSSYYRMCMIDNDTSISHYKNLVDSVHKYATPIILQISHCGRQTRSKITGEQPVAPSAIKDKFFNEELPKELTEHEIEEIIKNFVDAIERAKKAGFDGVQLHLAHGYLLAQFLSPYTNHRKDKWGGNTENRFRIIGEIFYKSKNKVGNYPILVKLNAYDRRKNGLRIEEAIKIAKLLEKVGCSAIEISCGVAEDGFCIVRCNKIPVEAGFRYNFKFKKVNSIIKKIIRPMVNMLMPPINPLINYNVAAAQALKEQISIPVIAVGGIRSIDAISDIIKTKKADFIAMSRPFIIEPDIVKNFKEGKQSISSCINCAYCVIVIEEKPLRCYSGRI